MTALSSVQKITHGGPLLLAAGVRDWIDTGEEPWATEPNPKTLSKDWRQHYVQVIVTCHLSGDQADTCDEDHALNQEVYNNPGCGGRLLTVWERNGASKIYAITDDWGGANAVTTVLFSSEY